MTEPQPTRIDGRLMDQLFETLDANHSPRGYEVHPSWQIRLRALANQACTRCRGFGISGWKSSGARAVVCRCVKANLAAQRAAAEEVARKTAEARAAEAVCLALAALAVELPWWRRLLRWLRVR